MKKKILLFLSVCALPLFSLEVEDLSWEDAGPSAQEFNHYLQQAEESGDFWAVIDYAGILSYHFPTSPFAEDAAFLIGDAYFKLGHLLTANDYLTAYLNHSTTPKRFEEAIALKFSIAEKFHHGERRPLFHSHKAPKWLSGQEDALAIYEEVIATLPHSDYAAKSLLGKAEIQAEMEDYKPSLETLDLLIRKFPKHELAAAAYLQKLHVYHVQCQGRSLDPDLLDLADVTLRKFRLAFPREPRIADGEKHIQDMEEIFAKNLLETGAFFQKTKKVPAAVIYYKKTIAKYPHTEAALLAQEKIDAISAS